MSAHDLRVLITAGLKITPEFALIAGAGWAREDAGEAFGNHAYDGVDIEGSSAYLRAEYALPKGSVVARAFAEYMVAR